MSEQILILSLTRLFYLLDTLFNTSLSQRGRECTRFFLNSYPSLPPRIESTTEFISHKESIPWNRCPGSWNRCHDEIDFSQEIDSAIYLLLCSCSGGGAAQPGRLVPVWPSGAYCLSPKVPPAWPPVRQVRPQTQWSFLSLFIDPPNRLR